MGILDRLAQILGRQPEPAVQPCRLAKGIICVVVSRKDKPNTGVAGVKVSLSGPTPGQQTTDASGIAQFEGRTPGGYQFGVALPAAGRSWQIDPYAPGVGVGANQVAIADVMVFPVGTLRVEVRDDSGQLITNAAQLAAAGGSTPSARSSTGSHAFADVACGEYTVSCQVDAALYEVPSVTSAPVTVPEGGTATAQIRLNRINRVTPVIDVIVKEAWFMPPPAEAAPDQRAAAGGDPAPTDPTVAKIRLRYTETLPAKPFVGGGRLSLGGAACEVFRDADGKVALPLDDKRSAPLTHAELAAGLDLYLRGLAAGAAGPTLELDPSADSGIRPQGVARGDVAFKSLTVVTPRIELEYKVVLLDKKLSQNQKDTAGTAETKLITADDVTIVQVSATQLLGSVPYTSGGSFSVAPAHVKVYTDMRCTRLLERPLTHAELMGGAPFNLYLKAAAKGAFVAKLTLEPSGDGHVIVRPPATKDMAVAELDLRLHRHDKSAIEALEVDPDVDPIASYHTALKNKALPDQKEMTAAEKVVPGRLLHAQIGGNHGRARLLLKKLAADQWPAGSDDYEIVLTQEALNDSGDAAGSIKLFDKEAEGVEQALPLKLKVKDLKAKDAEYWVEGAACSNGAHSVVLDAGLDRPDGIDPVAKEAKRFGDWARFTVVRIDKDKLKLDYTASAGQPVAWDEPAKRYFINFKADPEGRKIKLKGALTEKIAGVTVHFMLAPDKDNMKTANWGVDLPSTWKWKDVDAAVKHTDKTDRKKLLHLSAQTDDKGELTISGLQLSRFGGDVFHLAAYVDQDPHLSKFVDGHPDLGTRKPVMVDKAITVWRKFWYHEVKVAGLVVKGFGNAADTYRDVKVVMEAAPVTEMPRATADGINPKVIYKKHMVSYYVNAAGTAYVNNYPGDNGDALVVGDANESRFMGLATADAERPVKIPMLNAHGLWIADGVSAAKNVGWLKLSAQPFPWSVRTNKQLLDPPLQGGTLLAGGTWEAQDVVAPDPAVPGSVETYVNPRNGALAAGDIDLDPNRSDPFILRVKQPAGLVAGPNTRVRIRNLTVNGGTNFLGTSYADGIVNCYTPNDEVDFINTINHELGHSFKQTAKTKPGASIPSHPKQYDKQGSHCNYQNKSCLMYESGPQPVHLDRYCPTCQPYVLVQDWYKA